MRTSWQSVSKWYDSSVGDKGHYYHQHVVIPNVLRLLALGPIRDNRAQGPNPDPSTIGRNGSQQKNSVLDLACGQGVLARTLPKEISYVGLDAAPSLISDAKSRDKNPHHHYQVADITQPLPLSNKKFTHATIILALQNLEHPELAIANTAKYLLPQGKLIIVLNHPSFRIPRQSSWGIDPQNKMQYRKINAYMSPQKIPISAHPGQSSSPVTWSFHFPLSSYFNFLSQAGFVVTDLEEWTSDKVSAGKAAKMENRSRSEIPLFLTLVCQKLA